MESMEFDLIVGVHSIAAALKNSQRNIYKLILSDEGEAELIQRGKISKLELSKFPIERVSGHKVQELAKTYYRKKKLEYQRVPSQLFLVTSEIEILGPSDLYTMAENGPFKVLCLDQITDVHNAGAIIRTAAFYGVDAVVFPGKRSFGFTPSFFRIASGATEHVRLVSANNLSRVISKLNELNINTIGLSEHAEKPFNKESTNTERLCLVLGKEDTGISNAVMRQVEFQLSLQAKGEIFSLNVASAAAISMEKCFG